MAVEDGEFEVGFGLEGAVAGESAGEGGGGAGSADGGAGVDLDGHPLEGGAGDVEGAFLDEEGGLGLAPAGDLDTGDGECSGADLGDVAGVACGDGAVEGGVLAVAADGEVPVPEELVAGAGEVAEGEGLVLGSGVEGSAGEDDGGVLGGAGVAEDDRAIFDDEVAREGVGVEYLHVAGAELVEGSGSGDGAVELDGGGGGGEPLGVAGELDGEVVEEDGGAVVGGFDTCGDERAVGDVGVVVHGFESHRANGACSPELDVPAAGEEDVGAVCGDAAECPLGGVGPVAGEADPGELIGADAVKGDVAGPGGGAGDAPAVHEVDAVLAVAGESEGGEVDGAV